MPVYLFEVRRTDCDRCENYHIEVGHNSKREANRYLIQNNPNVRIVRLVSERPGGTKSAEA